MAAGRGPRQQPSAEELKAGTRKSAAQQKGPRRPADDLLTAFFPGTTARHRKCRYMRLSLTDDCLENQTNHPSQPARLGEIGAAVPIGQKASYRGLVKSRLLFL